MAIDILLYPDLGTYKIGKKTYLLGELRFSYSGNTVIATNRKDSKVEFKGLYSDFKNPNTSVAFASLAEFDTFQDGYLYGPLPVKLETSSVTITGPVTVSNEVEVMNDAFNPLPVSVSSLPLPASAATAAKQDTGNTSLASIDTKMPASPATTAKQDMGNTSLASIDGKIPAIDNSRVPVVPGLNSGGHISAQTAATGANYTAFASQACKQLTVMNDTGTTIVVAVGGTGVAVPVFTSTYYTFYGLTNANNLSVKRSDSSNTQVTVKARWEN
jgi:hypothetical protein